MCGGSITINPCSRVAHMFKNPNFGDESESKVKERNLERAIRVWTDDFKKFFQLYGNLPLDKVDHKSLLSRFQIRKNLKCKDFNWYLKNVHSDLLIPNDSEKVN